MKITKTDSIAYGVSFIIGQSLTLISVFFWNEDGRHTVDGAVLTILAMIFWAYGFIGLFSLFTEKNPWYARLGLLYAFYGCLGGIAFGFEGLYSIVFEVSDKIGVEAHSRFPMHMNLVLFWAGPAYPLTFMIFGIMFMLLKIGPWWIGFLCLMGGIAFPASRISRIDTMAHLADVVLFIPLIIIFLHFISGKYLYEERNQF